MAEQSRLCDDRIVRDPAILVGKPVVKGTRIPVELVLKHLAQNLDLADLFAAYPRLTTEDVQACIAYAGALVENEQARRRRLATKTTSAT